MPLYQITDLFEGETALQALAHRLATPRPGLVLATGLAASGKLTTLTALALGMSQNPKPVRLLTDRSGTFEVFEPLPAHWSVQVVEPIEADWARHLAALPADHIAVVSHLVRENAQAVMARASQAPVLAALDSPLMGLDAAYALREMGVGYEQFAESVSGVWSQILMPRLCAACSSPAQLRDDEVAYLFPSGRAPEGLSQEAGCEACDWRGTEHRAVLVEALVVDEANRRAVGAHVLRGAPLPADADRHISLPGETSRLMAQGALGVNTYRDLIRRNPLLRSSHQVAHSRAEASRLDSLFDKFVSPEVKSRLLDGRRVESVIQGESREITCLFCDVRQFTARAELRDPQTLFAELNGYFAEVVDAVLAHEGTIDKFIGDAVMALFGAPVDQADHAERAVDCALAIRRRVLALNRATASDLPFEIGIGVHSGRVAAGCVGTAERLEYTVLGDTVNVAARLESKAVAGQVLVSSQTRQQVSGRFRMKPVGSLALKGRAEAVDAFEVLERL
jgi:class 3 adenylate cyclase